MIMHDASVLLQQLGKKSPIAAKYALQKAAAKLQKSIKQEITSYQSKSHDWGFKRKNGHLRLTKGSESKPFYSRRSKNSGKELHGLDRFVYFRLYPMTNKALVGFMNTPSFTAYDVKNGQMRSIGRVKGTKTKEIGQRMEYGDEITPSKKQRWLFLFSGLHAPKMIKRKAHPVIRPAYRKNRNEVMSTIEKVFIEEIGAAK